MKARHTGPSNVTTVSKKIAPAWHQRGLLAFLRTKRRWRYQRPWFQRQSLRPTVLWEAQLAYGEFDSHPLVRRERDAFWREIVGTGITAMHRDPGTGGGGGGGHEV